MINIELNKHWISRQTELNPDIDFIIEKGKAISYEKFYNKVLSFASYFKQNNILEGENIGLLIKHNHKFIQSVLALWIIGAVPVPINLKNSLDEQISQITFSDCEFILASSKFADSLQSKTKKDVINIDKINDSIINNEIAAHDTRPTDTALMMFTSGSTGQKKAVVLSFENLFYSCSNTDNLLDFKPYETWLASLPFYHIGGFQIFVRALLSGGTVVFSDSLKTKDLIDTINKYIPHYISVVNTTLQRLIESKTDLGKKCKAVFAGGGPIDDELLQTALRNKYPVYKVYGSTETSSMITILKPEDIKTNIKSAGNPVTDVKLNIFDSELNEQKNGKIGEIAFNGKSIFRYYYKNEKLTKNKFFKNYYLTGDLGFVDSKGFLTVLGRKDSIIITGGEKVNPLEVENTLMEYSEISEAKVFGIKDNEWGQIVCAAIVLSNDENIEINNLRSTLKNKLALYKIPKIIKTFESLPKTDLGKIDLKKLIQLFV